MADVAELNLQLKQIVDESTTGSYPTTDECIDWYNESQDIVAEETECLTEIVSATMDVSAATTIAVPSDFIRCRSFVWSTNTLLTYVELEDLTGSGYTLSTTGVPSYWYIWDGYIRFYPVPAADTAYAYYYVRTPAALTSTSSTPEIPARWHKMLVMYAAYRFWMKEEEASNADRFMAEFMQRLNKAKLAQKKKHARHNYSVKDVRGYL